MSERSQVSSGLRDAKPRFHRPLRIKEIYLSRFQESINKNPKELYQAYLDGIRYARHDPHITAIDEYLAGPSQPQLSQPVMPSIVSDQRFLELERKLARVEEENKLLVRENSSYKSEVERLSKTQEEIQSLQE